MCNKIARFVIRLAHSPTPVVHVPYNGSWPVHVTFGVLSIGSVIPGEVETICGLYPVIASRMTSRNASSASQLNSLIRICT